MKVTLDWLEEYLGRKLDGDQLADQLTMAGLEVEAVDRVGKLTVLEIAITPNRGDCLSVLGLAMEISAITDQKISKVIPVQQKPRSEQGAATVRVTADKLCTRYCGQLMEGIKIGSSPDWMQQRLEACGIRAINNVVDVTNYVMLETGQPLHAFDHDRLASGGVEVRMARKGEDFTTLDGKERKLLEEDLVIADSDGPVALAGVMGGVNCEVQDSTERLFLESAYFDALSVRRTSKRLGLQSESSYRFERGIDWYRVRTALDRMIDLLSECAGARPIGKTTDVFGKAPSAIQIPLDLERVVKVLGGSWKDHDVEKPLKRLGCSVKKKSKQQWEVSVPSHRSDLQRPVDLIEEVARLRGYETIPAEAPPRPLRVSWPTGLQRCEEQVKQTLQVIGFSECIHYSFCSISELEKLGSHWSVIAPALANPLSQETGHLRPTLLSSLLSSAYYHQNRRLLSLRLFELRKVFQKNDSNVRELTMLSGLMGGEAQPSHWSRKTVPVDFYEAKGVVEAIIEALGLDPLTWSPLVASSPYSEVLHPSRSAGLQLGGVSVGVVGELHPERESVLGLQGPIFLFELDWTLLASKPTSHAIYQSIPSVPWVERDLAVVVDEGVPASDVESLIKVQDEELVRNVMIFDVYRGKQIPDGKKSLAFRYYVGHPNRTLTDEEVDVIQEKIVKTLKKKLQASIR